MKLVIPVFPENEFHCTFTTPSIHPLSAPTAMKQGTRRRMEQPINACGQFVCFTATCEIRKFLLMRLRWRVLTKKAFHFFTRIVKSSSSSFMVLPTDRPTDLPETRGLMWMPSGDCRQFHLARVGNSSDAGHALFELL